MFQIPMRGNESIAALEERVLAKEFQIPMRGNELQRALRNK